MITNTDGFKKKHFTHSIAVSNQSSHPNKQNKKNSFAHFLGFIYIPVYSQECVKPVYETPYGASVS